MLIAALFIIKPQNENVPKVHLTNHGTRMTNISDNNNFTSGYTLKKSEWMYPIKKRHLRKF